MQRALAVLLLLCFIAAGAVAQPINPPPANGPVLYQSGAWTAGHCLAALGSGPGVVDSGQSCVPYTGPGNIQAHTSWWGLRAYSSATRGRPSVNICNPGDAACIDFYTDPITGRLTPTPVGGVDCTTAACTVKTAYDRAGGGQDLTQATIANRVVLTFNCGTAWVCMTKTASAQVMLAPSVVQTSTFSLVAVAFSNFAVNTIIIGQGAGTSNRVSLTTPNSVTVAGSGPTFVVPGAPASAWGSYVVAIGSGTNASVVNINGVETTGTLGGLSSANTPCLFCGGGAGNNTQMTEGGIVNSAIITPANRAALVHNQCQAWAVPGC